MSDDFDFHDFDFPIEYKNEKDLILEILKFEGGLVKTHFKNEDNIETKKNERPQLKNWIKHGEFIQIINDIPTCKGTYFEDKKNGLWEYFVHGELKAEEVYNENNLVSLKAFYHEKVMLFEKYKDGLILERHLFDLDGNKTEIIYFENAKIKVHEWYKNGKIIKQTKS